MSAEDAPRGDSGAPLGGDTGGTPWVTLREASEAAGVSVSALRKWRRVGDLPSRMEPGPTGDRVVVPLDAVLDRAGRRRLDTPTLPGMLPDAPPRVPEGYELVPRALVEQFERLMAQAASAHEAGERVGRAEAERDVYRQRLEESRGEAERLRAELEALRTGSPAEDEPTEPEPSPTERVRSWWRQVRSRG